MPDLEARKMLAEFMNLHPDVFKNIEDATSPAAAACSLLPKLMRNRNDGGKAFVEAVESTHTSEAEWWDDLRKSLRHGDGDVVCTLIADAVQKLIATTWVLKENSDA